MRRAFLTSDRGSRYCPWDNGVASLQMVYANSDTKVFRIAYNGTG